MEKLSEEVKGSIILVAFMMFSYLLIVSTMQFSFFIDILVFFILLSVMSFFIKPFVAKSDAK